MSLDILFQKTVKIRKIQSCWGCLRKFDPGTKLLKIESVDSGDFVRAYWCDVCQHIIDEMDSCDRENGFYEGDIKDGDSEYWESIRDEVEEN